MSLFDSFRFRNGATASNGVWLAPLTNLQSNADGTLNDNELRWLERRAQGGFGVVETCAAYVSQDGKAWAGELGIDADDKLEGLTKLASAINAHGAKSLVQIFHGGMRADESVSGMSPWGASAVADPAGRHPTPRAGSVREIEDTIVAFKNAAVRAEKAGFSGVEIHGAHGYVLSQFLSATMNTRTDAWGGSFENRARMLRNVMQQIRESVSASFIVGVRMSPEDFGQARGVDLDEGLQLAKWLVEDGADFLHLSLWDVQKSTLKRPEEHPITLFRNAVSKDVPLVVAGHIWTREDAEHAIALGAQGVALGRSAIGNADWPKLAREQAWEPARPPYAPEALMQSNVSASFVQYLRNWKNFVQA